MSWPPSIETPEVPSPEFLAAVQQECSFDEGELRVIMVEGQPMGKKTVNYRVHDASSGMRAEAEVEVEVGELRRRQAWASPAGAGA